MRLETSPWRLLPVKRRDHERPFGEVRDRAEVDVVRLDPLAGERRKNGEAERRQDDAGADDAAEADRGEGQEAGAAIGLEVLLLGGELRLRRRVVDERVRRRRVDGACVRAVSRIQRRPKTIVIAAPRTAAGQLTTSPTRMHAIPIAKPIGQRLWPGV